MTDTLALDFLANVAVVAGVIILLAFKDLEQSDVDDPLRSWRLNGILAFICAVYVWNGDSTPAYPPESSLGTLIVWGMTVVWIGHATYHLGLFRLATDQTNAPQLLPNSLGIATSALIALLEELLFRGWLQNELYRVDHALSADVYSIFAINLLFGLMHYNRGFHVCAVRRFRRNDLFDRNPGKRKPVAGHCDARGLECPCGPCATTAAARGRGVRRLIEANGKTPS